MYREARLNVTVYAIGYTHYHTDVLFRTKIPEWTLTLEILCTAGSFFTPFSTHQSQSTKNRAEKSKESLIIACVAGA